MGRTCQHKSRLPQALTLTLPTCPLGRQPLTACPCEVGSECLMGHQLLPAGQNTKASHPLTNPGTAKVLFSLATTLRSMIVDHNIIIDIARQGKQSKTWPHSGPGAVWRKLAKPHLPGRPPPMGGAGYPNIPHFHNREEHREPLL